MTSKSKRIRCHDLVAASGSYLLFLFSWLGIYLFTGDRFTVIALINFIAVYLFFPLILVLVVALICKSRWLGVGFIIGGLAFFWFWGDLFLPKFNQNTTSGPSLTIMTYNVLAWHDHYDAILETIKAENPDILLLQELNNGLASILENELSNDYPFQVLNPVDNPEGIGVISKFPIRQSGKSFPQLWAGGPQVLELDWGGEQIILVNIHMSPTTGILPLDEAEESIRSREREAQMLADLAGQSDSVILGGDANTSFLSGAYQIISSGLTDSFREMGLGFGHTFPGSKIPESDRPHIGRLFVPPWMTRIDYIFHSDDWSTISARTARFDGVSDHRGVIVELGQRD